MPRLTTCELEGSPSAMGEAFGERFREEIRAFADSRANHLAEFIAKYDAGRTVSREHMRAVARGLLPAHREFDARVWDEFSGIAAAAGLSEEDLLIANGLTDIRDLILFENPTPAGAVPASGADDGECTSFLVPAADTEKGPIAGQTWDMHPDAIDFLVVVRRRPDDAPETVGLTTVGCLSLIGLNSEGVAVCNNNLVPTDPRAGVNYLFTITRALSCRSADEAASVIESAPRLSGHNFAVADGAVAINIETTARAHSRTAVTAGAFVHANHHDAPETKGLEFGGVDLSGSRWREARLAADFAGVSRPVTADDCWDQLSDNERGAGAVCNEDYDGVYGDSATVATVVIEPEAGRMYAVAGGARLGERETFAI